MNNLTLSVIENQIFLEVLNELRLFSKFKIKFYKDINLCTTDSLNKDKLIVFFYTKKSKGDYEKIKQNNLPAIIINKSTESKNVLKGEFVDQLIMPFRILDLEKKIVSLVAKYKFRKSSLINLNGYIIDKNERKIKKNDIELQLTEKEIDFLILFSQYSTSLSRDFVLKNVWNYSTESETHTLETHIHRLRKKISKKFNDNNFIKNNDKGYYI
tara:strand:+ start:33 stop:671 length:639 start_codon:yes stop_codon:yes gene_type:complete